MGEEVKGECVMCNILWGNTALEEGNKIHKGECNKCESEWGYKSESLVKSKGDEQYGEIEHF